MAPGAHELTIGGDSCNNGDFGLQGLFDADLVNIDGMGSDHHPLSTISSNSWGPGNETQPAILTNIMHAYLVRAAAQGVGMYFASGDASGLETPTDPFTILVGGTTLGIGKHDTRLFETGWSSGFSIINAKKHSWVSLGEEGATSGGPSLTWAQPSYQRGVVPRALATAPGNRPGLVRSEPDISAAADLFTGFLTGILEPQKNGTAEVRHLPRWAAPARLPRWWPAWSPTPSRASTGHSGSPTRCSTSCQGRTLSGTSCRRRLVRRAVSAA